MRTCVQCQKSRPEDDFHRGGGPQSRPGYRRPRCKDCIKSNYDNRVPTVEFTPRPCTKCGVVYDRDGYGTFKGARDGYHRRCKKCKNEEVRVWATPEIHRVANLAHRHGMTVEQYTEMVERANGRCESCGDEFGSAKPHIDHDHSCCPAGNKGCGKCIRGLLCQRCNLGLGHFRDELPRLEAAIRYLQRHQDQDPPQPHSSD
jgi:hypothetical protein